MANELGTVLNIWNYAVLLSHITKTIKLNIFITHKFNQFPKRYTDKSIASVTIRLIKATNFHLVSAIKEIHSSKQIKAMARERGRKRSKTV